MPTTATFKTSEGTIVAKLFEQEAPETVANFIALAEGTKEWSSRGKKGDKLYDGTIFHRVIPEFMIQGGDPEGTGMGGPGYKFAGKHTIFGEVTEGYDIVEKISKVPRDGMDRPKKPVVLESVTITKS